MQNAIRYAIAVNGPSGARYLARDSALLVTGNTAFCLHDAKTFGTESGARKWMADRPEWTEYRTRDGATVEVVPVRMKRGSKVVPVALAGAAL